MKLLASFIVLFICSKRFTKCAHNARSRYLPKKLSAKGEWTALDFSFVNAMHANTDLLSRFYARFNVLLIPNLYPDGVALDFYSTQQNIFCTMPNDYHVAQASLSSLAEELLARDAQEFTYKEANNP